MYQLTLNININKDGKVFNKQVNFAENSFIDAEHLKCLLNSYVDSWISNANKNGMV